MQPYPNWQNAQQYQQPQQMYNPMEPYINRMNQLQQQYQQQPMYQQQPQQFVVPTLQGKVVDSVDVVKATDVDMNGNVMFYPKSDMTEIYTKQLQIDGTSRILTYKISQPDAEKEVVTQTVTMDMLDELIGNLKQDLLNEISGIKQMFPIQTEKQPTFNNQNGGKK